MINHDNSQHKGIIRVRERGMSNQYIRRKFCEKCGSKTYEATVQGSFDKESGEPNTRDICTNQKCVDWCDFNNQHNYSFFGGKCRNCGHFAEDYL